MGNENTTGIFRVSRVPGMAADEIPHPPCTLDFISVYLYPMLEDRAEGSEK